MCVYIDIDTHRHTHTQTHRHTDTQTHRHTDTHTHTHTHTQILSINLVVLINKDYSVRYGDPGYYKKAD